MDSSHLKCRHCDYAIKKFYRNKKGKLVTIESAFAKLRDHVEEKHPDEFSKLQKAIISDYGTEGGDVF